MDNAALQEPRALLRPRPIRIAYLVEDGAYAHEILDAIFAECHTRWGGRYSLVVPCEEGAPRPAYLPWLGVYDPDIIYSYVALDATKVHWLHETFGPSYLVIHQYADDGKRDRYSLRPRLPLACLTALSVALQYARAFPASAPQPLLLVDAVPGQPQDQFVRDNFGLYVDSFGRWPLPASLADSLRPLIIASEDLLRDPRRGYTLDGETVPDTVALLQAMAAKSHSVGVAQLAADATPRLDLYEHFAEACRVVIGDTFSDRVIFWNERSVVPAYLGKEVTTLVVSPARLDETDFCVALATFLQKRNGVHRSGGIPVIQLTSASVSSEQLAGVCDRLQAADPRSHYQVAGRTSVDAIVPSETSLRRGHPFTTGHLFDRAVQWKACPASGAALRLPSVLPAHLQGVQHPSMATAGAWALDVDIERQNNLTRVVNVRHTWHLPRRFPIHGAFRKPYEGPPGSAWRCPRGSREGYLVLFTAYDEDPPVITLPDDETALRYALEQRDEGMPFADRPGGGLWRGPYAWSRPSDKGRYLLGALRLLGGLQNAGSILLHAYWHIVLQKLGGGMGPASIDTITSTLKKRLRHGRLATDEEWERVARVVAAEARRVRRAQQSLSFEELRKCHEPFLEQERQLLAEANTENPEEWMARVHASLPRSVQRLCTQGVLYQGHEWRCGTCYHTNWHDLSALQPTLRCAVCNASEAAPVDTPWSFRLHGFLREALQEHGLRALVWCLIQLEQRAQGSFFFLGPHDLFLEQPAYDGAAGDQEIDLICVIDGRVHLCEVKSSARQINLAPLIDVAKRVRPDVVTLAVMESASPKLRAHGQALQQALMGTDISAELLTLEEGAVHTDAYLLASTAYRIW